VPSNEPVPEIVRVKRGGPQLVSITQEHVLKIETRASRLPLSSTCLLPSAAGAADVRALELSLAEAMRRHESLRTRYVWRTNARRTHRCRPPPSTLPSLSKILRLGTGRKRGKALLLKKAALRAEQSVVPFDVSRAPLFSDTPVAVGTDDHVFNSDPAPCRR